MKCKSSVASDLGEVFGFSLELRLSLVFKNELMVFSMKRLTPFIPFK